MLILQIFTNISRQNITIIRDKNPFLHSVCTREDCVHDGAVSNIRKTRGNIIKKNIRRNIKHEKGKKFIFTFVHLSGIGRTWSSYNIF